MQADRVMLTRALQDSQTGTTVGKEVLRVNLQKINVNQPFDQLCIVGVPPANTHRWCLGTGHAVIPLGQSNDRHGSKGLEVQVFFDASASALASSIVKPFICLQVPLATYFHSPLSMSTLAWPEHECAPEMLAQSF
jgi:hypothetical protein